MATGKKENEAKQALPPVRIMTRTIGPISIRGEVHTGSEVELSLEVYYAQGYRLFATHFMGMTPQGVMVIFILALS